MGSWIGAKLHQVVKEEIDAGKKMVVCPYGEWGMYLADILEKAYGIKDAVVLDNGLYKYNSAIYPVEDLKKWDTSDMTLLLTSVSSKNRQEIQNQIKELGIDICVKNIFEPEVEVRPDKGFYFRELKKALCCKKVEGKELIRIGSREGDGGYVMVDDFDGTMRAYSCGIGNDVSWDMDIANKEMSVFMYDHTIDHLPKVHNCFHFYRLGIGEGSDCLPLEEILKNNGDLDNRNLILKMDIEGAEWEVLTALSSKLLNHFKQIALELHDICKVEYQEKILNVLQKIKTTHQAVWIHGNNANNAEMAEGILIPNVIEVTYARRDSYKFNDAECKFPMSLDLPNLRYKADFELGNWGE